MALNDYTIDNRGDVGSWVRDAAMEVLVQLTQLLTELHNKAGDGGILVGIVTGGAFAREG